MRVASATPRIMGPSGEKTATVIPHALKTAVTDSLATATKKQDEFD
jgi:hypothetical protein